MTSERAATGKDIAAQRALTARETNRQRGAPTTTRPCHDPTCPDQADVIIRHPRWAQPRTYCREHAPHLDDIGPLALGEKASCARLDYDTRGRPPPTEQTAPLF